MKDSGLYEIGDYLDFLPHIEGEELEGLYASIIGKRVILWTAYFSPTEEEINDFNTLDVELGVSMGLSMILFAYKLWGKPWQEIVYSYPFNQIFVGGELSSKYEVPLIEELGENEPLNIILYLYDSGKGIIVGKRSFNLTDEMKAETIEGFKIQNSLPLPLVNSTDLETKMNFYKAMNNFIATLDIETVTKGLKKSNNSN